METILEAAWEESRAGISAHLRKNERGEREILIRRVKKVVQTRSSSKEDPREGGPYEGKIRSDT